MKHVLFRVKVWGLLGSFVNVGGAGGARGELHLVVEPKVGTLVLAPGDMPGIGNKHRASD